MNADDKKAVLRLFTYGLYVVTCRHDEQRNAFTANWLTQISFEPPLLVVSIENSADSLGLIRASGMFAVCVLRSGQRELAGLLGRSRRRAPDKLAGIEWLPTCASPEREPVSAPPILADSLGYLRCAVDYDTAAGDSTLVVARIVDACLLRGGEPLTMRETGFRHSG